jgi:glutamine cyclotransferase
MKTLEQTNTKSGPAERLAFPVSVCLLSVLALSCSKKEEVPNPPLFGYEIVKTHPHRSSAFTQGLVIDEGFLYEGTGTYGQSTLSQIDMATGSVLKRSHLPKHMWGEGITIFRDRLYQLTWRSQVGFVYDKKTFKVLQTFAYAGEGWGLTHDGRALIMSNGSATLTFLDPNSLDRLHTIQVTDANQPVQQLNELEYIDGKIYANVWLTDDIVTIDPGTGQVTARIDLSDLKAREIRADVLNGIAYDKRHRRLFVTGKYWSTLYEIKLVPATPN